MEAEVVGITQERSCRARLSNQILVVFAEPRGHSIRLGNQLRFVDLKLDADVQVINLTTEREFTVHIAARDVHDLRVAASAGELRTPSLERLRGP